MVPTWDSQGSRIREYQIKDAICHLESLEQLDLGENEIDSLPVNFGALTKLRELWLDTNDIKVLPQSIGGLKDLSIADFANNKIEVIPDTIEGCIRIGFFFIFISSKLLWMKCKLKSLT